MAIHFLPWQQDLAKECQGGALTIGNFDGVHLGHGALLQEAKKQAESVNGPSVAMVFDPHPFQLLRPDVSLPVITTTEQRAKLMEQNGLDHVLILNIDSDFLQLAAEEFFQRFVVEQVKAQVLVEGTNFGFGHDRKGNIETLKALCAEQRKLIVVSHIEVEGIRVSSSRVRQTTQEGNVGEASKLLGRRYEITGLVVKGAQRGRTLGFPTANLAEIETLIPAEGVYAVSVELEEKTWAGAANVGPNPTFKDDAQKFEVHLVDFKGDLYDRQLTVQFHQRLRATRPFQNVDDLLAQLQSDIKSVREIVAL